MEVEKMKELTLFGADEGATERKRGRQEKLEDYAGFVEKFKRKKTTDDCYTPPAVYDAVVSFVRRTWDIEGAEIIRPFFPDKDYQKESYPDNCVVIDNPPFSILSQILRWFCAHGIRFFLFAPSLTLFTARDLDLTYVVTSSEIVYANGAIVKTGFIANLPSDLRIWVCPDLREEVEKAKPKEDKSKKKFVYPDNIVVAAVLQRLAHYSVTLQLKKSDCYAIPDSDGAKKIGRSLYGGAFLLDTRAAAERAAADVIELSPRERAIIKAMDEGRDPRI